jgi:hypothetical protein
MKSAVRAIAMAAGLVVFATAVAARAWLAAREQVLATSAQVDASLVDRGVAWIWPGSNGPAAFRAPGYREAAVLVETLVIHEQGVERLPRTQPLVLPVGVKRLPVLHVEAASDAPDMLSEAQIADIVAAFLRRVDEAAAGAGVLQLDFEVPRRERASYSVLVARVRAALPAHLKLSVTALAHWCSESDWLDHLPVDEVVPMLYRLGPHAGHWRAQWSRGDPALAARCRGPALGFATNDPPPAQLLARTPRPYWFDESAWSNASRPQLPPDS